MKQLTIIVFLVVTTFIGCRKLDIEKGTPKNIENKIKDFNKSSICNTANVKEYIFQGNPVYTFDPGRCGADMNTEVTNSDGNTLGYLGGIVGNTKINSEEFSKATFVKSIWKK